MMRSTVNYSDHVDEARAAFIDKIVARMRGIPYEEPPMPVLAVEQTTATDGRVYRIDPSVNRKCICGCGIRGVTREQQFASAEHRAAYNERKRKRPRQTLNCLQCEKPFLQNNRELCCSPECHAKRMPVQKVIRNRDYRARMAEGQPVMRGHVNELVKINKRRKEAPAREERLRKAGIIL
jgi:hypothetical protein